MSLPPFKRVRLLPFSQTEEACADTDPGSRLFKFLKSIKYLTEFSCVFLVFVFNSLFAQTVDFDRTKYIELLGDLDYFKRKALFQRMLLYENTPLIPLNMLPIHIPRTRVFIDPTVDFPVFVYSLHSVSTQFMPYYSSYEYDNTRFGFIPSSDNHSLDTTYYTAPYTFNVDDHFLLSHLPISLRFPVFMNSVYLKVLSSPDLTVQDFQTYFDCFAEYVHTDFFDVNFSQSDDDIDIKTHFQKIKYLSNSFGHCFDNLVHYCLFRQQIDHPMLKSHLSLRNFVVHNFAKKFFSESFMTKFSEVATNPLYHSSLSTQKGGRNARKVPEAFVDFIESFGSRFQLDCAQGKRMLACHSVFYYVAMFQDSAYTNNLLITNNRFSSFVRIFLEYSKSRNILIRTDVRPDNFPVSTSFPTRIFPGNFKDFCLSIRQLPSITNESYFSTGLARFFDKKYPTSWTVDARDPYDDKVRTFCRNLRNSVDDLERILLAQKGGPVCKNLPSFFSHPLAYELHSSIVESCQSQLALNNRILTQYCGFSIPSTMPTIVRSLRDSYVVSTVDTKTSYNFHSHIFKSKVVRHLNAFWATDDNPDLVCEVLRIWNNRPALSTDIVPLIESILKSARKGSSFSTPLKQFLSDPRRVHFDACQCFKIEGETSICILRSNLLRILSCFGFNRMLIGKFLTVFKYFYECQDMWKNELRILHFLPHECTLSRISIMHRLIHLDIQFVDALLQSTSQEFLESHVVDYYHRKNNMLRFDYDSLTVSYSAYGSTSSVSV